MFPLDENIANFSLASAHDRRSIIFDKDVGVTRVYVLWVVPRNVITLSKQVAAILSNRINSIGILRIDNLIINCYLTNATSGDGLLCRIQTSIIT